jgi:phosphoglucomutase
MLDGCPFAGKNHLVPVLIIFGKRTVFGQYSVGRDANPSFTLLIFYIAWLNIIAAANKNSPNKLIGINDLLQEFYSIYGRSFFSRYDYEDVSSEGANALVDHLNQALKSGSLDKSVHVSGSTKFTVSGLYNFEYKDPIDHSVSKNQGQVIKFADGSRVVFRLSGTGSQGATVRMYVERYVPADAGAAELAKPTPDGLNSLIEVALEISKLKEFLGRDQPTVITVSFHSSICWSDNDRYFSLK